MIKSRTCIARYSEYKYICLTETVWPKGIVSGAPWLIQGVFLLGKNRGKEISYKKIKSNTVSVPLFISLPLQSKDVDQ